MAIPSWDAGDYEDDDDDDDYSSSLKWFHVHLMQRGVAALAIMMSNNESRLIHNKVKCFNVEFIYFYEILRTKKRATHTI